MLRTWISRMWQSHEDRERERFHDATIEAIHRAADKISHAITQGFKLMADTETQAVADLQTAIAALGDAIAGEIAALQAALSNQGVDSTGPISDAVTNLNNLTAKLKESIPAPVPEPAPAPVPPAV